MRGGGRGEEKNGTMRRMRKVKYMYESKRGTRRTLDGKVNEYAIGEERCFIHKWSKIKLSTEGSPE